MWPRCYTTPGLLSSFPHHVCKTSLGIALEIIYLGHSAFRLRGKEVAIVTDPFPPDIGISMGNVSADIVTVSHPSPNHSFAQGVTGGPRLVNGPGEYEVAEVLIAGVATVMQPGKGPENTAFVFRFEDLAICHLGDIYGKLTDKQLEEIGSVDVLMIPTGGGRVLDPTIASLVVAQVEPSLVIPMHYRLPDVSVDGLEPVEVFCREMGTKEFVPEQKLTVTRSSMGQETRVAVLEPRQL
ncbi:MAG: MBL fold metallo-hydrolase [Chloroflexota bacterium]